MKDLQDQKDSLRRANLTSLSLSSELGTNKPVQARSPVILHGVVSPKTVLGEGASARRRQKYSWLNTPRSIMFRRCAACLESAFIFVY